MLSVALTGNVASGKSAVAEAWTRAGVSVVSADVLAREAVAPGKPGLGEVREAFGDGVLAADGTLDRAALRARIFGDEEARRRLEAILHPRIRALRDAWLRERAEAGDRLVVAEIPLLYETGLEEHFDLVVLVHAPAEVRLARLTSQRGLSEEEARRIMAAQMDPDAKRRRADVVIDNDGTLAALRARAAEVLRSLRVRAGEARLRLDLHLHTVGSWDCLSDPHAVVERAAARGVERIAITDHNRLDVALRMAEALPDRVIPGEEVKTAEGIDVIGLYLSEVIPKGTPARETIERIRAQGGIPYLPHPFAAGKGGGGRFAEELAPLVDVIEVFNGRLHPGRLNARAEELARRHEKLRGGGSDAHTLTEVAGVSVEVAAHANGPDALLRALADATVRGRTASQPGAPRLHLGEGAQEAARRAAPPGPVAAAAGHSLPFHRLAALLPSSPSTRKSFQGQEPVLSYRTPDARVSSVREVRNALLASRRAVLTTHLNADGDGAGSEAALTAWLRANGTEAHIVNPTPFPDPFRFLVEDSWVADASSARAKEVCERADLAVVVDTGEVQRIGRVRSLIRDLMTVVIDHHPPGDQPIGGFSLRDSDACAAGELVYDVLLSAGGPWPRLALEGMYVAILTDTGSFRFTNATPGSHRVVADLIARGVDPEQMYAQVYGKAPVRKYRLLRRALDSLELDEEWGIAWMVIPQDAYLELGATQDDLEGMVDIPRGVEGAKVGLLFRLTTTGEVKVSFRSNGPVDVNELARRFGGGGHVRASGAVVPGPMPAAVAKVVQATRDAMSRDAE